MIKYVAETEVWKRVNMKLNISSLLSKVFNITKISQADDCVYFYASDTPSMESRNSYGNGLGMLSTMIDMNMFLDVIRKSYTKDVTEMYVHDRFTKKESDTLILYPIRTHNIMEMIPKYVDRFYKDSYDLRFTPDNGFHDVDLVINAGEMYDSVLEDVSFLMLKDANVFKLYDYKILNMIPFEEHVDDIVLQNEKGEA